MKYGTLIFLAAFLALAGSWGGFVLAPQIQLGRKVQAKALGTDALYPQARPGLARQGAEVYRANGCVYCHSQQVGEDGVTREVVLKDAGTNHTAVIAALQKLDSSLTASSAGKILAELPQTILTNTTQSAAKAATKSLESVGAKVETQILAYGPDISRGWGKRRSVAQDYLFDYPVQPGSLRIGPDLANVGLRSPDANWHLLHLYSPRAVVKGSTMPPYRFLFETRKIEGSPSPDALNLPAEFAPPKGYEVVATEKARMLVAYLLSLHSDAALFEAPVTPPPQPQATETNAPTSTATAK